MYQSQNNKSPIFQQENNLIPNQLLFKTSELGFRRVFTRHKKHKPYELANRRNNVSLGHKPDEPETTDEGCLSLHNNCRQIFGNEATGQKQKSQSENRPPAFSMKKETFKQFIHKIQKYNKRKLISEFQLQQGVLADPQLSLHKTQICINPRSVTQGQHSLEIAQRPPRMETSFHQYIENSGIHITGQEIAHRIDVRCKDKSRQFVIHQSPNRALVTRGCSLSKTEQHIKLEVGDGTSDESRKKSKHNKKLSAYLRNLHANFQKPFRHESLKQAQCKHPQPKPQPRIESGLRAVNTSKEMRHLQDKDLSMHKKLLETKYSKIRIRFGSSLYNKNLWRLDAKSKENLRKQLESICCEDLISINYDKNDKRPSLNSIFCQNKIQQAQEAFIQKRRLIPSNTDPRGDSNKTSKRFFSMTNCFKRHKTMNCEGNGEKVKKGEKLNGWEILEDGLGNDKIEEFF